MGLGHDIISGISSLVGKGLTRIICGHVCIIDDYSTHLRSTRIIVWLGLSMTVVKGLKLTCINESGSVLLIR